MKEVIDVKTKSGLNIFRHEPSPLTTTKKFAKIMTKRTNKTTTLSAQVAVSKSESGMDYVQVLPDNPRVGMVQPFHGIGYGQMLSNGNFDFIRKKRSRRKPEKKTQYGSLSFGQDGYDRYIFVLPSDMRQEFPKLLMEDSKVMANYLKEQSKSR